MESHIPNVVHHYRLISAEMELKNSLQEWITKVNSVKLRNVLQRYLLFVQSHVQKMDFVNDDDQIRLLSLSNHIMHKLIRETNDKLSDCKNAKIKDIYLLASLQKINHFKMGTYGTTAAFAQVLGMERAAIVFHEAETNEKYIDHLSQLVQLEINN